MAAFNRPPLTSPSLGTSTSPVHGDDDSGFGTLRREEGHWRSVRWFVDRDPVPSLSVAAVIGRYLAGN